MKKHRLRTKPEEVLFPVNSKCIIANHETLSRAWENFNSCCFDKGKVKSQKSKCKITIQNSKVIYEDDAGGFEEKF